VAQDDITREANLVLLTHIAHIEEFFVMVDEKVSTSVQVDHGGNGGNRPPDHFLDHKHSNNCGRKTSSAAISSSSAIDIIPVFALSDVHPVLLDGTLIVSDSAVEHVLGEELHSQVNGHLVVGRDAAMLLVKPVKVVLGVGVLLSAIENRHFIINY